MVDDAVTESREKPARVLRHDAQAPVQDPVLKPIMFRSRASARGGLDALDERESNVNLDLEPTGRGLVVIDGNRRDFTAPVPESSARTKLIVPRPG